MAKFITFEGGEGCGKSTLIENLKKYFEENEIPFVLTREPGGLPVCEEIRNILKYSKSPICPSAELLLFSASRAQLVNEFIKPSLKDGKNVLCDRFYDSTRVYQGYGKGITDEDVMKVTNFACGNLNPDITFYLSIDPVVAFKRKGGADKGDRFEEAGLEFHRKVREGYLKLAKLEPNRIKVINAEDTVEGVLNQVLKVLKEEKVI